MPISASTASSWKIADPDGVPEYTSKEKESLTNRAGLLLISVITIVTEQR